MNVRVIFKSGHVEEIEDADYRMVKGKLTGIVTPGGNDEVRILDPDSVAMVRLVPRPKKKWWQR